MQQRPKCFLPRSPCRLVFLNPRRTPNSVLPLSLLPSSAHSFYGRVYILAPVLHSELVSLSSLRFTSIAAIFFYRRRTSSFGSTPFSQRICPIVTRKRQRTLDMHPGNIAPANNQAYRGRTPTPVVDDGFINDHDAVDDCGDDDGDKPKLDKAGRGKTKIEFIQDKSRRRITFSGRKAGAFYFFPSCIRSLSMLLPRYNEKGTVHEFIIRCTTSYYVY